MRIVFFGTPYYVLPILEALHKAFKERGESPIEAVVTQPPRPTGRKKELEYSAVDKWAHKRDIPIYFDSSKIISNKTKADVGILASYGEKIPEEVIKYFDHGILVIHPSLLPKFRWGSPVPAAIVTNSNPTGVTIIKMDEKWDHGPIITQFKEDITDDDNYESLRDRLFARSAEVLVQALPAYISGKIRPKPQDDTKASFARMITKEDAFIPPKYLEKVINGQHPLSSWKIDFIKIEGSSYNLQPNSYNLYLFIKAMSPRPGAWTEVKLQSGKDLPAGRQGTKIQRLKILKAHISHPTSNISHLILDTVQLEGKNPVTWEQFKEGYPEAKL